MHVRENEQCHPTRNSTNNTCFYVRSQLHNDMETFMVNNLSFCESAQFLRASIHDNHNITMYIEVYRRKYIEV
jgi:hypothetical protein